MNRLPLSPGDRVGRYVIDTPIGEGPRGIVYRATREGGGRTVALKVLDEDASTHASQVIASVRSAAALDHPNIAAIVEVGEHGDNVYIARDFVRGTSAIARKADTPLEGRVRWLIEAATAVHAAHMRGVTHGALTEGNVLVEEDGTLKLTDFGLGEDTEALEDRRDWVTLAHALIDDAELTPALRDAIASTEADASLIRAASALERTLSATRDVPIADAAPVGTVRTGVTTGARESPHVMRFVVPLVIIAASLVALYVTRRPVSRDAGSVNATEAGAPQTPPFGNRSIQAQARFNGAMQSMKDASIDLARAALDEALLIDRNFAAAHLRRALVNVVIDATSREHFGQAMRLRGELTPHDRTLLEAFSSTMSSKPTYGQTVRQMKAAAATSPNDVDFAYYLGFAEWLAGDYEAALQEMGRALAIDPHFALAARARAYLLLSLDRAPEAIAEYTHCLAISPAATSCVHGLADAQSREGNCVEFESMSRRLIALSPSSPNGYGFLALTLAARGEDDAARIAATENVHRLPETQRSAEQASFNARFAILRGDFDAAERAFEEWERAIADGTDEWERYGVTELRMELLLEMGRSREAGDVGAAFLARQSVLTSDPLSSDTRLLVLGPMHRAARASNDELEAARRGALFALNRPESSLSILKQRQYAWLWAYSASVSSADEARAALRMLPEYPALPPIALRDPVEVDGLIGRIRLLAGEHADALINLRRSATSCLALNSPIFHTQLLKLLADAEAATHETKSACSTYTEVLRRWQPAKSQTASAAKSALRRLKCPL